MCIYVQAIVDRSLLGRFDSYCPFFLHLGDRFANELQLTSYTVMIFLRFQISEAGLLPKGAVHFTSGRILRRSIRNMHCHWHVHIGCSASKYDQK